jgi:hypothetical protein
MIDTAIKRTHFPFTGCHRTSSLKQVCENGVVYVTKMVLDITQHVLEFIQQYLLYLHTGSSNIQAEDCL